MTKIPDNDGAKNILKQLIAAHPEKFPEIPQDVILILQTDPNADILDIVNGDMEIDPSYWDPTAPKYIIKATDALKRKNELMEKAQGQDSSQASPTVTEFKPITFDGQGNYNTDTLVVGQGYLLDGDKVIYKGMKGNKPTYKIVE